MTSGSDLINNNWQSAECNFYAGGSALAQTVAIGSLITGQYWATIGAAAGGLAFEYAAGLAGCNNNPSAPGGGGNGVDGCRESLIGATLEVFDSSGNWVTTWGTLNPAYRDRVTKIVNVEFNTGGGPTYSRATVEVDGNSSVTYTANFDHGTSDTSKQNWRLVNGDCTDVDEPLPPDAIGEPTYVQDGECTWSIVPKDSFIDASGAVRIYYVMTANNDACGGPFAYWSGPNGPTPVNPNPPDDGPAPIPPPEPCPCEPGSGGNCPDPCPDIPPPHQLGAKTYQLTGICETVPDGQAQPRYDYNIAANRFEEVLSSKLDALALMLQQHLALKTPTCRSTRPELRGDWRSVHFESDAPSAAGTRPLRKYFRYRSESGSTVAQLGDHWKDFTWQAGSVIVVHKGGWWGTPKVWAASIDEGKRVIRHAGAEAGIDPDQVGEWIVTGSSDPRYGMSGTMRPVLYDGLTWATARTGPDGPPTLETDS